MDYHDEDGGPEHAAIQSILEMLDDKGGELMRAKHGPKEEHPVGAGHVVTVEIKPHGGAPEGSKKEEADESLSEEMLESLLGEDDGDEKE